MGKKNFYTIQAGKVAGGTIDVKLLSGYSTYITKANSKHLGSLLNQRYDLYPTFEVNGCTDDVVGMHMSRDILRLNGIPVECAFQGSKIFRAHGPMDKLYKMEPIAALEHISMIKDDTLECFYWDFVRYPAESEEVFYDYLTAMALSEKEAENLLDRYKVFVDIKEYAYAKSSHARSVCAYKLLCDQGKKNLLMNFSQYTAWHKEHVGYRFEAICHMSDVREVGEYRYKILDTKLEGFKEILAKDNVKVIDNNDGTYTITR